MSITYNPSALLRLVRTTLIGTMKVSPPRYLGTLAKYEKSTHPSEQYVWAGEAPRMRLLGADGVMIWDTFSDASQTVTNQIWATGIQIQRKDLDDDAQGVIRQRINERAQVASGHLDRVIVEAMVATTAGYDGSALFADAHAARGQQTAAQDNNLAGTGTTNAQVATDLWTGYTTMAGIVAENGEPYDPNITEIAIVYPTALARQVTEATQAGLISSTTNVFQSAIKATTFMEARLADANDILIFNISNPNDLPLILQERDGIEVSAKTDGDDAFDGEIYKYKVRWRGRAAPGKWQRAARIVN